MRISRTISIIFSLIFFIVQNILSSHTLNCRKCKNKLSSTDKMFNKKSPHSVNSKESEVFGQSDILTHIFRNPAGYLFPLVTLKKANLHCDKHGYEEYTFFPGYAWSTCQCPFCGTHQGWLFTRLDKYCHAESLNESCRDKLMNFFGVSLDNIESEESLLNTNTVEL